MPPPPSSSRRGRGGGGRSKPAPVASPTAKHVTLTLSLDEQNGTYQVPALAVQYMTADGKSTSVHLGASGLARALDHAKCTPRERAVITFLDGTATLLRNMLKDFGAAAADDGDDATSAVESAPEEGAVIKPPPPVVAVPSKLVAPRGPMPITAAGAKEMAGGSKRKADEHPPAPQKGSKKAKGAKEPAIPMPPLPPPPPPSAAPAPSRNVQLRVVGIPPTTEQDVTTVLRKIGPTLMTYYYRDKGEAMIYLSEDVLRRIWLHRDQLYLGNTLLRLDVSDAMLKDLGLAQDAPQPPVTSAPPPPPPSNGVSMSGPAAKSDRSRSPMRRYDLGPAPPGRDDVDHRRGSDARGAPPGLAWKSDRNGPPLGHSELKRMGSGPHDEMGSRSRERLEDGSGRHAEFAMRESNPTRAFFDHAQRVPEPHTSAVVPAGPLLSQQMLSPKHAHQPLQHDQSAHEQADQQQPLPPQQQQQHDEPHQMDLDQHPPSVTTDNAPVAQQITSPGTSFAERFTTGPSRLFHRLTAPDSTSTAPTSGPLSPRETGPQPDHEPHRSMSSSSIDARLGSRRDDRDSRDRGGRGSGGGDRGGDRGENDRGDRDRDRDRGRDGGRSRRRR
ncbi:hypothetical protein GGF31_004895 [Allomyces arbusculus]|nr:hypothetical protein GGF31_004895 [Allomyces arbusculus]